jgi:hypothetical protein
MLEENIPKYKSILIENLKKLIIRICWYWNKSIPKNNDEDFFVQEPINDFEILQDEIKVLFGFNKPQIQNLN